ncbi:hypothetical protein ACJZ2D_004672 [Fusarium nematophilum]
MTEAKGTVSSSSQQPKRRRVGRKRPDNAIEIANKISDDDFIKEYIEPNQDWTEWKHPQCEAVFTLSLSRPAVMRDEELEACFGLVDETSGADYRSSSLGWHAAMKKKEMRSPDLRYILVKDGDDSIKGFASMMPTFENHEPVVYCYEIHLKPELQGLRGKVGELEACHAEPFELIKVCGTHHSTGLGRKLMGYLMDVAENIPTVEKVMLTCFVSNASGLKFYDKLGFRKDDFSPRERKLRGGKVVIPDFVILSRPTAHGDAVNTRARRPRHE